MTEFIELKTLCAFLEEEFRVYQTVPDGCPNGLQLEGRAQIRSFAVAVTASLQTIEESIARGVDCLIVHHGLFWNKEPLSLVGAKGRRVARLFEKGISLIAYHLPLDMHPELGNNWCAAKEMGWCSLAPFATFGVQGSIKKTTPELFQRELESYYGRYAQVVLSGPAMIERVALISGGAHRFLPEAVQAGMDAYVTGTVDEPVWHQAKEERCHFFALGHAATERVGPSALGRHLYEQFKIPYHFILDDNPF